MSSYQESTSKNPRSPPPPPTHMYTKVNDKHLKRQTRDARKALIAACVEKGESCHPKHPCTSMYTHKCIHTVLVSILQYVNEYTRPTNLVCLGAGVGKEGGGKYEYSEEW